MANKNCKCSKGKISFISEKQSNGLERMFGFRTGYECSKDYKTDKTSHGVHGAEQIFVLKGPKGASQFLIFTNWLPSLVENHSKDYELTYNGPKTLTKWEAEVHYQPMAADLGYHAKIPQYEEHEKMDGYCEYTDGDCYYDGSGLQAEDLFKKFLKQGMDVVWETLEKKYEDIDIGRRVAPLRG